MVEAWLLPSCRVLVVSYFRSFLEFKHLLLELFSKRLSLFRRSTSSILRSWLERLIVVCACGFSLGNLLLRWYSWSILHCDLARCEVDDLCIRLLEDYGLLVVYVSVALRRPLILFLIVSDSVSDIGDLSKFGAFGLLIALLP